MKNVLTDKLMQIFGHVLTAQMDKLKYMVFVKVNDNISISFWILKVSLFLICTMYILPT